MAFEGEKAEMRLRDMSQCSMCMNQFTDPRTLPCTHKFCFQCIKHIAEWEELKSGDTMPCPVCGREFTIPSEGVTCLQKQFLIEKRKQNLMGSAIICDMCYIRNEGETELMPTATMCCLECQESYCDGCVKVHQFHKLSRSHQMFEIGCDTIREMKPFSSVKYCIKHTRKPLDYYCIKCRKIVCVSCFVESHRSHDCKDVTTLDEEFRQAIEKNAWKISNYEGATLSMIKNMEKRKADFLKEIVEKENEIRQRNQELKEMIDRDTKSLLDDLSVIKENHLKEIKLEIEEIDRCCISFRKFETYCNELTLKGTAIDICSSVDELIAKADELEKDHEAIIGRPFHSVEVSFQATNLEEVLQKSNNNNVLGQIIGTTTQAGNYAIVVGLDDGATITKDVIKLNLHRPNEISTHKQIPTTMVAETTASVCSNIVYLTGAGEQEDEIWKYNIAIGWMKCASLVQGRRRQSAAFVDEVLYICGGFVGSNGGVLDTVEAYDVFNNKCTTVGKLVHGVESSGNCVPFRRSLYIFGGSDKDDNSVSHVQVYNTNDNSCTLLSKPMPRPRRLMRAALWETSVVLVGCYTCLIFNFETETWHERELFKTGVSYFGLILESEKVFVIGGGINETDEDGKETWKCRDDVRYVPLQNILQNKPIEWKIHGKLPKPFLVQTCAKMRFPF